VPRSLGDPRPGNIINFRGDKDWAMLSVIAVNVWRGFPFTTIIILAGLTAIPDEILERARLEGANGFQRFVHIISPMVRPILMVSLLFSLIFSFTDFNTIWIITKGGPYDQTQVLSTYAYQLGVNAGYLGKGASISLFMFPIMATMVFFMLQFLRRGGVSAPLLRRWRRIRPLLASTRGSRRSSLRALPLLLGPDHSLKADANLYDLKANPFWFASHGRTRRAAVPQGHHRPGVADRGRAPLAHRRRRPHDASDSAQEPEADRVRRGTADRCTPWTASSRRARWPRARCRAPNESSACIRVASPTLTHYST
jgi:hypothetical protein